MIEKFNDQQEFTQRVLESQGFEFPLSITNKVVLTKEYILYLMSECNDLLQQLDWKSHWKTAKPIINSNVGIEIIDIQKYVWGLAKIWGIDGDEFNDIYDRKSLEVESKWRQEISLLDLSHDDRVCVIDIDGVLTPYPECFVDWVRKHYDKTFSIEYSDLAKYEHFKHFYRDSGAKRTLPFIESSKKALELLNEDGYTIVLLTNRPYSVYKRIYRLKTSGMTYDYIFWAEDKKILSIKDKCKGIKFVVDDSEITCKEFRDAGIKAYQYNKDIESLMEIEELKC
jgi:hypothetical protein